MRPVLEGERVLPAGEDEESNVNPKDRNTLVSFSYKFKMIRYDRSTGRVPSQYWGVSGVQGVKIDGDIVTVLV